MWGHMDRYRKIATICSFFLISVSLLVVNHTPAVTYELSIYASTPTIFWLAIFSGVLLGIWNVFNKKSDVLWLIGLLEIILCNVLILALYVVRGYYYLERGDVFTYVGFALDILQSGCIGDNFYPFVSILLSALSTVPGITTLNAAKLLPVLICVLYLFSVYCWAKSINPDKIYIKATLVAAVPLFFASFLLTIYHMTVAALLLPLLFYLLNNGHRYQYVVLLVLFMLVLPFTHPFIVIMFFVYLVLLYFFLLMSDKKRGLVPLQISIKPTILLILLIWWTQWFIQTYALLRSGKSIFSQIFSSSTIELSTGDLAQQYIQQIGLLKVIQTAFLAQIDELIYLALGCIALCYIYAKIRNPEDFHEKIKYYGSLAVIGCLTLFITAFFLRLHNPVRILNLNFNVLLCVPIVGYLLYETLIRKNSFWTFVLIFFIVISGFSSYLTLYQSPNVYTPNDQVTKTELVGMQWFIDNKCTQIPTSDFMSPVTRYVHLIYGYTYGTDNKHIIAGQEILPHFSQINNWRYTTNETTYIIVTQYDITAYTEVWSDVNKFDVNDFNAFNHFENTNLVYDNTGFSCNLVCI
jgi:hypothetical protein